MSLYFSKSLEYDNLAQNASWKSYLETATFNMQLAIDAEELWKQFRDTPDECAACMQFVLSKPAVPPPPAPTLVPSRVQFPKRPRLDRTTGSSSTPDPNRGMLALQAVIAGSLSSNSLVATSGAFLDRLEEACSTQTRLQPPSVPVTATGSPD
jgi:hypothetical protein